MEPICMYIPNCDTGSTHLRKAISHTLAATRCVYATSEHIWVFYCRKHYQRSRYSNPKEYANLECDLYLGSLALMPHSSSVDPSSL